MLVKVEMRRAREKNLIVEYKHPLYNRYLRILTFSLLCVHLKKSVELYYCSKFDILKTNGLHKMHKNEKDD
ncbi:MAG: hypothetical protein D3905_08550 [Candidatus Electrothrix sp. AS4_5]|nr:hypothetical protein [Candidatus Electrothrix gigas]